MSSKSRRNSEVRKQASTACVLTISCDKGSNMNINNGKGNSNFADQDSQCSSSSDDSSCSCSSDEQRSLPLTRKSVSFVGESSQRDSERRAPRSMSSQRNAGTSPYCESQSGYGSNAQPDVRMEENGNVRIIKLTGLPLEWKEEDTFTARPTDTRAAGPNQNGPPLSQRPATQGSGGPTGGSKLKTLELHIDLTESQYNNQQGMSDNNASRGKNRNRNTHSGTNKNTQQGARGHSPPECHKSSKKSDNAEISKKKFEEEFAKLSRILKKELVITEKGLPCGAATCCPCNTTAGAAYLKDACKKSQSGSSQQYENRDSQNRSRGNSKEGKMRCDQKEETTVMLDANTIAELTRLLSNNQPGNSNY
ncbi:hypothetical protein M8J76_006670 [Diaphorina citri]|nr:hypothetical protein M8J76_006670 [Diaphorina citri]